ncbi:hypothetical protein BXY85_0261 [Roseivirga pacifica]|uniref:Uncharacterized protein n=1 Tax=Roseivirga pacifica TaxID=1267423 RepID=A0A1I0RB92_9BACT|nr:hypothetical protein [Roseivirga pacifica]RKQ49272.1 hypothetical protein BXY85_0261 [Roseivirga pacifica]SEW37535.1 hypothetical protein SAMN05216290_3314 [Roseivirga pacifica]
MKEKGLLFRSEETLESAIKCPRPINLDKLKVAEQIFSAVSPLAAFGVSLPVTAAYFATKGIFKWDISDAFDPEAKLFANEIEWDEGKMASISSNIVANALQGDMGLDLTFTSKCSFTPPFEDEGTDGWDPKLSNFQDQVTFMIKPFNYNGVDTPTYFSVDQNGCVPETNNKAVDYSSTKTWKVDSGFKAGASKKGVEGSLDFKVGYSFSESAKVRVSDFEIVKASDSKENSVAWLMTMKNMYEDLNRPAPYHIKNLNSLVVKGALTNWLHMVPDLATYDMNPEVMATFRCSNENLKNIKGKKLYFKVLMTQQLKHIEIVGRWGLRGGRMGGLPMTVPGSTVLEAVLELDVENKSTKVIKHESKYWSIRNIANKDVKPLI